MTNKNNFKRYISTICLLLIITIAMFSYYIGNKTLVGHDMFFHLNRIIGLSDAIKEGQILPKIYPYSNNGFGYASPLFYCDIFLYLFAILYSLGVPLLITYKMMIFIFLFITAINTYYVASKIWKHKMTVYFAVVSYMFANYHIINVFNRSALGEIMSFAFIPLCLYSIYEVLVIKKDNYILLALSFTALLFSHLISTVLIAAIFLICIIVFVFVEKDKKTILPTFIIIIKGAILASFISAVFLLPFLEQIHNQKFYFNSLSSVFRINESTQTIKSIFYPFVILDHGDIYFNSIVSPGYVLLFVPILYVFVKKNKIISFILVTIIVLYISMIGLFKLPEFLDFLQFSFRFYILICPLSTIVAVYTFDKLKKEKIQIVILCLAIVYSALNMVILNIDFRNNDKESIYNKQAVSEIFVLKDSGLDYDYQQLGGGEYLPYCVNTDYIHDDKSIIIKNLDGDFLDKISVDNYTREYTTISFTYNGTDDAFASLPLSYYKGYKAFRIDEEGQSEKVLCVNDEVYKRVGIYVSKGNYTYVIQYSNTKIYSISLGLSALGLASFFTISLIKFIKRKKFKENT